MAVLLSHSDIATFSDDGQYGLAGTLHDSGREGASDRADLWCVLLGTDNLDRTGKAAERDDAAGDGLRGALNHVDIVDAATDSEILGQEIDGVR